MHVFLTFVRGESFALSQHFNFTVHAEFGAFIDILQDEHIDEYFQQT